VRYERPFYILGPAAANALSPKVLYVRVTTHVWLAVERSRRSRASATRRQKDASKMNHRGFLLNLSM